MYDLNVAWCSEVFVCQDCTFDVVRESVGGMFSVGTSVSVGIGAGIDVCILLVPSCSVESDGSTFGIGTGAVGIGDGITVCILLAPFCTV